MSKRYIGNELTEFSIIGKRIILNQSEEDELRSLLIQDADADIERDYEAEYRAIKEELEELKTTRQ